jgi:hypothetical protein
MDRKARSKSTRTKETETMQEKMEPTVMNILSFKKNHVNWFTLVISALGRQQKSQFEAHLGYIARPCIQKKKKFKKIISEIMYIT